MMSLLKRFEEDNGESEPLEEGSEDEADDDDLQHRLAGVNLGTLSRSTSLRIHKLMVPYH